MGRLGSGAHGFTNVKSNPTHAHMHSYRHTHSHTHTYTRTHTHTHARTPDSAVKQQPPIGCVRQRAQEPFTSPSLTWPLTLLVSLSLCICLSAGLSLSPLFLLPRQPLRLRFNLRQRVRWHPRGFVNSFACASVTPPRLTPLYPISPSSPRSLGCFCSLRF